MPRRSNAKGSTFERETCKRLSLWWTNEKHDDVFWRTDASGGRATTRSKKSLRTHGQVGDICATHPIGEPLIDLISFELKRGYNKESVHDLFDRPDHSAQKIFEGFFDQAITAASLAGSFAWIIVQRRDSRQGLAWMPTYLVDGLLAQGAFETKPHPFIVFEATIRRDSKDPFRDQVVGMLFDDLLRLATPHHFQELARQA